MPLITKTMKLHLRTDERINALFKDVSVRYADACEFISGYVFNNGFPLNFMHVQNAIYYDVRERFGLKSQLTISALKTVTARYKTVQEQLFQNPYKYKDENGDWKTIPRTLEWMTDQVHFKRPQADLVRNRDYSFYMEDRAVSVNTLGKRVVVSYDLPDCFLEYFDGTWSFGTAKLVSVKGDWYLHVPVEKNIPDTFDECGPAHVVGIDRGLRFLANTYDETGKCFFFNGQDILRKRDAFLQVRAELQSKGTKSAKRKLKAISGREKRWMSDANHQISKALVDRYGSDTLFVIEDLSGVSFAERSLASRTKEHRSELRSWAFYELEQDLGYKASEAGSLVLKVPADYTSQRCPKCGRIHKENRKHETHEYICDKCGYRSNDDRIGAMNLQFLGTLYVSGDPNPRFRKKKSRQTAS